MVIAECSGGNVAYAVLQLIGNVIIRLHRCSTSFQIPRTKNVTLDYLTLDYQLHYINHFNLYW